MRRREKIIRVFISSTFEDMKLERDLFQREIFERLSSKCNDKGWQLEFIDLRWGISNAEKNVMSVCIDELNKCKAVSPVPFLFILIGNRYGWIPMPETITQEQWDIIINHPDCDKTLLEKYYSLDCNNTPQCYLLDRQLDDNDEDCKAIKSLFYSVDEYINKTDKSDFWRPLSLSATHNEINHGVELLNANSSKTLCYFRDIKDYHSIEDEKAKRVYIHSPEKVKNLKQELEGKLEKGNIIYNEIDYSDLQSEKYLKNLENDIYEKLWSVIENEMESSINPFEMEFELQEQFVEERLRIFEGRDSEVATLKDMIDNNKKVVVLGDSGSGKSSLMAKLYNECKQDSRYDEIFCSIGISPLSHSGLDILTYIISTIYNQEISEEDLSFNTLLSRLLRYKGRDIVIFIDAINQLHSTDPLRKLISANIGESSNVKFVFSAIKTELEDGDLGEYNPENRLKLGSFNVNNGVSLNIINKYLVARGRVVTERQRESLKDILEHNSNLSPLYLRLLSIVVAMLKHNDTICYGDKFSIENENGSFVYTVPTNDIEIIKGIISYYAHCERYGNDLTYNSLAFILNSARGVSYNEILELFGEEETIIQRIQQNAHHEYVGGVSKLPPTIWSHLYYDIKHLLSTNIVLGGEVIAYYHSIIKDAVKDYIDNDNKLVASDDVLTILKRYYSRQWYNMHYIRSIDELPEILIKMGEFGDLRALLLDINYIQQKAKYGKIDDIIREYEAIPKIEKSRLLEMIYKNIKRYSHQLLTYCKTDEYYALQFILNLYSDAELREYVSGYINKNDSNKLLFDILNKPAYNDDCAIELEFHGAVWSISDIDITNDGTLGLSVDDDNCCRVWNMHNGSLKNLFYIHNEPIKFCCIIDNSSAVSATEHEIAFWNFITGTIYNSIVTDEKITSVAISKSKDILIYAIGKRVLLRSKQHLYKNDVANWEFSNEVTSLLVIEDKYFVAGFENGDIIKQSIDESGDATLFEKVHNSRVIGVKYINNGSVAAISRTKLSLYAISGECATKKTGDFTTIDADNDMIVTGAVNGIVTLWSECLSKQKSYKAHSKDVTAVLIDSKRERVLSASRDRRISIININKDGDNVDGYNSCVYLSYNGEKTYSVSDNGELISWSWDDKKCEFTGTKDEVIKNFPNECYAVDTCPNNRFTAVATGDGEIELWDNGCRVELGETKIETFVNAVRFSSDGRFLAVNAVGDSSSADSVILEIYDLFDKLPIKPQSYNRSDLGLIALKDKYNERRKLSEMENKYYILHINGAYGVAFSNDSKHIAIALSDKSIAIYNHISREMVKVLKGDGKYCHTDEVKSIAFTPDYKHIVSGSWDNKAILWDIESGEPLCEFKGHTRGIYAIDISKCGNYLLTGARDHTIILWHINRQEMLGRFVYTSSVNSVKFLNDGCGSTTSKFIAGFDSGEVLLARATAEYPLYDEQKDKY